MPAIDFNGLDTVVHGPVRLGVITALAAEGTLDFTSLVKRFEAADGAMAMHLRKLEDAGYIACTRQFVGRRPKSTYGITTAGRKALRRYLATMQHVIDAAAGAAPRTPHERRGAVLIMALVALALIAALGGTLLRWARMEHKLLRSRSEASQARWLAEAGVERAAAKLTRDANYAGETWQIAAADVPSGEAARVRIAVKPDADHARRRSIHVAVEYPLHRDAAAREHREIPFQLSSEDAL